MMIYVYFDGAPVPLTAHLQFVAESLLGVAHSLICPCQKLPSSLPTLSRVVSLSITIPAHTGTQ
jgi:hypothetical protein